MNALYTAIDKLVYDFFVKSNDYNGIPLRQVSTELGIDYIESIDIIKQLVSDELVMIQSSTNPHIYNFVNSKERQIDILESAKGITETIENNGFFEIHYENTQFPICLYPTHNALKKKRDVSAMGLYSKRLALCEPQLKVLYFDLNVLERYSNDPRYELHYNSYSGYISYECDKDGNSDLPKRNQIYLKSFGLGYDSNDNRIICVFLTDLGKLSETQQAYWYSFEITDTNCKMTEEYYKNMVIGSWTNSYSIYRAFTCELNVLNELSEAAFGTSLFLSTVEEGSLSFSFLPTSKNYYDFTLKLDKMISDNLNRKFFKSFSMVMYTHQEKDGVVERKNKGTLQLFEEWLKQNYITENNKELDDIFQSLRKVRKERQVPAHKTIDNVFSKEYAKKQDLLMREVYYAMTSLRHIFQQHPKAKEVETPKWLDEGVIKMF
jgi:hypothetical protein